MPNLPSCEEIYALVVPYMLDTLGSEGDAPIDAHLKSCEHCRDYFEQVHEEYCARVQEQFDPYTDRELDPHERKFVEDHLGACGRCSELYTFNGTILTLVKGALGSTDDRSASVAAVIEQFRHATGKA